MKNLLFLIALIQSCEIKDSNENPLFGYYYEVGNDARYEDIVSWSFHKDGTFIMDNTAGFLIRGDYQLKGVDSVSISIDFIHMNGTYYFEKLNQDLILENHDTRLVLRSPNILGDSF